VLDFLALLGQLLGLGRERRVLGGQLAGGGLVVAEVPPLVVRADDRAQLAVPAAHGPRPVRVAVDRRVRQVALELGMLSRKIGKPLEHCLPPALLL
jgi:hypothetical protein